MTSINKLGLKTLSHDDILNISGGGDNVPGTLADEVGYFFGWIWGGIVTSHRARAKGYIIAYEQRGS